MRNWQTPQMIYCDAERLAKIIRASAFSVGSAMEIGEFLDGANVGMSGSVYMDFNPGHAIQVEVIGRVIIAGYLVVELLTEYGERITYRRPETGGLWLLF